MTADEDPAPLRRRSRWRGIVAALLVAVVGCVVVLWLGRRTIATAVIDRKLAEAHVPARYRIADLGFGRQRLVDVVVGDPAHPDLVADWMELATRIGFDGAQVTAVRAGTLRMRGTLTGGRLSLGSIDRLLPQSTGAGPFRLPVIDLDVGDGHLLLTTPQGVVELGLSGKGRLDNGFAGRLTASSARLAAGGCLAERLAAATRLSIRAGAPAVTGPVQVGRLACGSATATDVVADLTAVLGKRFASWRGRARLRAASVANPQLRLAAVAGTVTFAGSHTRTGGTLDLASGRALGQQGLTAGRVSLAGHYLVGTSPRFVGRVGAAGASLPAAMLAPVLHGADAAAGTPVAPLASQAAQALGAAGRRFDLTADVALDRAGVVLSRLSADASTGATATFSGGSRLALAFAGGVPTIDGVLRIGGGGLPSATVRVRRAEARAPFVGVATVAPYAAGTAQLALAPIRFSAGWRGATRIDTVATLSGPFADGRVDNLAVPIAATWKNGSLAVGPGCATVAWDRLAVSSLRLAAARLPICPTGPALVRVAAGKASAGATIGPLRLAGSLGSTPLMLAASGATASFGQRSFTARDVAVRLGSAAAATRLGIASLTGRVMPEGLAGQFAGAGGQIGQVPLLLSGAAGDWRLHGGALALGGTLAVADTAASPRFRPLRAVGVALRLAGREITADGQLVSPNKGVAVANVKLAHDLARGTGRATLAVPQLMFTERFQPDELTPLTFGVIADVRGAIRGDARIGWSPAGVTSTGTFTTGGLDLAAALGPVTGLAGTIRFTDLLALQSAPDQVATVATINPGIAVTDGRIVFQTLPGTRVRVAGGHWPFAGGSLDLAPTLLDFSAATERRLTFTLAGVDAAQFLQQFNFGNISASGVFDGSLPMSFTAEGGRIEGGHLTARHGGGNIAYVGELTQKDLGVWGNLAFQALRSLDYRDLAITMNGPLAGEMITEVRFAGISQGKGAKSNFLIRRLQKLPFAFNIKIRAPFRGLIDAAQSYYDPSRLIERNLPTLIEQQNAATRATAPIQPPASETVP